MKIECFLKVICCCHFFMGSAIASEISSVQWCDFILSRISADREGTCSIGQVLEDVFSSGEAQALATGLSLEQKNELATIRRNPKWGSLARVIGTQRVNPYRWYTVGLNPNQQFYALKGISDDIAFVLKPPLGKNHDVWNRLTDAQKMQALTFFFSWFANGEYDAQTNKNMDARVALIGIRPRAFSPFLYFVEGIRSRKPAGVCRQLACGLAGLLFEIGVPREDIELLQGRSRSAQHIGHLWVRIKVGGSWVTMNPPEYFSAYENDSKKDPEAQYSEIAAVPFLVPLPQTDHPLAGLYGEDGMFWNR